MTDLSTASPVTAWLAEAWAQAAEVREVVVEGAMVRYRGWGLDAVDKPGLVLVHGFLAHARWWDHIGPRFTDRFRVIAPDFTGMGDSGRRPSYSRRQYARETIAATRHAGLDRATLVAHSFGGASSLFASVIAPELFERVIVIDADIFRSDPERDANIAVPLERFYPSFAAARARYRLKPAGAWPNQAVLDYIACASIRESSRGWSWKFDPEIFRSVHREALYAELRGLPNAVDFIHASNSEVVGAAQLQKIRDNMPFCGAPVSVSLSHHHIMIEQPVGLISALNGLLANPRFTDDARHPGPRA